MASNNLFRIIPDQKTLKAVKEVDFIDFNIKERYDIQEWIIAPPEILAEDLLIISVVKIVNFLEQKIAIWFLA